MSKNKGHVPIRTCISCGSKRSKYELIRLIVDKEGVVRRDDKGRLGGRGAYVCPEKECIKKIISRPQLLSRALKRKNIKFSEPIGGIYEETKGL